MTVRFSGGVVGALAFFLSCVLAGQAWGAYPGVDGPVAFTRYRGSTSDIAVARVDGGPTSVVVKGTDRRAVFDPSWSPSGKRLAYLAGQTPHVAHEVWVLRADGTRRRIAHSDGWELLGVQFLPRGRVAYIKDASEGNRVYTVRADGTDRRRVRLPTGMSVSYVRFSPDRSRIAFGCFCSDTDRRSSIYVMRADGSRLRRIGIGHSPDWSPSGRRLVYARASRDFNKNHIVVARRDGSGVRRLTSHSDSVAAYSPSWSPSGRRVIYTRIRRGDSALWVVRPDGSNEHRAIDGTANAQPEWGVRR